MTATEDREIVARVRAFYDDLVEETGSPTTNHDRARRLLLSDLLDIFNHLIDGEESPFEGLFPV